MRTHTMEAPAKKDFTATYECLGVNIDDVTAYPNGKCDCPFCDKPQHFFVNLMTGQFDCKTCGKSGNVFTFLGEMSTVWQERTTESDWAKLAKDRGIPAAAFKEWGLGYNRLTGEWLMPVYSDKGTVRDVRRWNGENTKSTAGCNLQLFGLWELSQAREKKKRRVWVCEGEWDAMTLKWLLKASGIDEIVVAVPGAGIFKTDWVNWFLGCDVIFVYDNDSPGDDGATKASKMLFSVTKRQRFICWPELVSPKGWDTRDHVKAGLKAKLPHTKILESLEALLSDKHRRDGGIPTAAAAALPQKMPVSGPPPTFGELLKTFERWIKVDRDFKDALAVVMATYLSTPLPGEPLWFYIIGVPSSGKGVILGSLANLDGCSFHSSFTAKSLVSGFNTQPDPSLLPQLNHKTAVFKDGTELLAIHPDARKEAYATLRGAFDGRVDRGPFGNGVIRRYHDLHFSMLIGVTPAIHADSEAGMGARFLNLEMRESFQTSMEGLYQAASNSNKEVEIEQTLQEAVTRFLSREIVKENLPKVPMSQVHRIVAMSRLIAVLRAQVQRNVRDRDLQMRPYFETGKRVVKQMMKLSQVLAVVYGKREVDADVCRVLRKVMTDTCVGFHVDIFKAMVRGHNEGMTLSELISTSRINAVTIQKRIEDMEDLGILRHEKIQGKNKGDFPIKKWFLTEEMMMLWDQSLNGVPPQPGNGEGI